MNCDRGRDIRWWVLKGTFSECRLVYSRWLSEPRGKRSPASVVSLTTRPLVGLAIILGSGTTADCSHWACLYGRSSRCSRCRNPSGVCRLCLAGRPQCDMPGRRLAAAVRGRGPRCLSRWRSEYRAETLFGRASGTHGPQGWNV